MGDNGHTDYVHSNSSLVSSLLDQLQEVPMA